MTLGRVVVTLVREWCAPAFSVVLALSLLTFAAASSVHSVHHLDESAPTDCSVATATGHLSAVGTDVTVVDRSPMVTMDTTPRSIVAVVEAPVRAEAGRAPPRPHSV